MTTATPSTLTAILKAAQPGDTIQLSGGNYPGTYDLRIPGITLEPVPNESPKFTGPAKPVAGTKPVWLKIWPTAKGTALLNLKLERLGDITKAKAFNDWGIVVSAPNVTVKGCWLSGMTKGIQIEGKASTGVTIISNTIDPTYQANIVVGTSYGVVRGLLIIGNVLRNSYIEDGIQFVQDFSEGVDQLTDVSNIGAIVYGNTIEDQAENAIDLKGAAQIVIAENKIRRIAGSNDGPLPPAGWNHKSPMSIMHGANASRGQVCRVLIRNNDIEDCSGGIRVFPGWHVVHNRVVNNNFDPTGKAWAGIGIVQNGDATEVAVQNNLASGNLGVNVSFDASSSSILNNPPDLAPGVPLTYTRGAGAGDMLPVQDADYFTDWFGRDDLPPDVLYLNGERNEVESVDYDGRTVRLDHNATWQDGDAVYWNHPAPMTGIQEEYTPPVGPPVDPPIDPTEPPIEVQTETVTITLSMDVTPEAAAVLRSIDVSQIKVSIS
jgi:hypothetical protein